MELILKESIRIKGKDGEDKDVYFDTTVQEKNITFSTLRQTYTRTLKRLSYDQRFRNHPKNKGKAKKADKKVKTIAGRLVRDVERKLDDKALDCRDILELFKRVRAQKRNDKNKIHSLHEPEVCCTSKGKEHKPHEFGNKASFGWTASGVVVGGQIHRTSGKIKRKPA